ncbi:MAG: SBBP repeat-containing protein [Candidatus Zixiibacteriota bacterium]
MILKLFIGLISAAALFLSLFTGTLNALPYSDNIPIYFTENLGQWRSEIKFKAELPGISLLFTPSGVDYRLTGYIIAADNHEKSNIVSLTAGITFPGSNISSEIIGEDLTGYRCHYLLGDNPASWKTDVANYAGLIYKEIYTGVDLRYFSRDQKIEYDFVVRPGADPAQIKVKYDGIKSVDLNDRGELVVETGWNRITEHRPRIYQLIDNRQVSVAGEFVLLDDNLFGFKLTSPYDAERPLVIDPMISFSTYLGGGDIDEGTGITVDDSGYVYVTGSTYSEDFPIQNPLQDTLTSLLIYDVFVTKINPAGDALVFSTYLGGVDDDFGNDIAVDGDYGIFLTGRTHSSDFPIQAAYQSDQTGVDAFLSRLNHSGDSLVFSTYLGGDGYDESHGLTLDRDGNVYLTGETVSSNFPVVNSYLSDQGLTDAFISKFNNSGSALQYSTYLGGSGVDCAYDIAVDTDLVVYITGYSQSNTFPSQNPVQTQNGGEEDIFVSVLDITGNFMLFSSLVGSDSSEYAYAIALDSAQNIYIAGETKSVDLTVTGGYQTSNAGGRDVYLAKIGGFSHTIEYGTYLGGGEDDRAFALALDGSGKVCCAGVTGSADFPVVNAFQDYQSGDDIFLTRLNMSTSQLEYSSHLGGTDSDRAEALTIDNSGDLYLTGTSSSDDLPLIEPYLGYQAVDDAFVYKITGMLCVESDGDGYGDSGYPGNVCPDDNCPDIFNPNQADFDGDGVGDVCDNCPETYNPGQDDINGNNRGDVCDFPRVWYVNTSGTGDAPTIQAAIDSASHGDTVLVASGTYSGDGNRDLDFGGRNIILMSESGPENTTIDCDGSELEPHRGIYLHNDENSSAVVDGFKIIDGYGPTIYNASHGGGVMLDNGVGAVIRNCHIENNRASNGGGICLVGSSSIIINCILRYNEAVEGAGLMSILSDSIELRYCAFYRNESTNKGGAVSSLFTDMVISNMTVCRTNELDGGDVIYSVGGAMIISNSLLAFNTGTGRLINAASLELSCCNFYGNADATAYTGDILTEYNPFFCDTATDNFHIDSLSPCAASFPLNVCGVLLGALSPQCQNLSDADGDGVYDEIDNCSETYNPDQADANGDGVGDACCCIGDRGNVNCSAVEQPDISDITRLIDYLYLSHASLCCPDEADANGSGGEPDISDITALIDHLYISHRILPACP